MLFLWFSDIDSHWRASYYGLNCATINIFDVCSINITLSDIFCAPSVVTLQCQWHHGCALWSSRSPSLWESLNIWLTPCLWTGRWSWSLLLKVGLTIIPTYEWVLLVDWMAWWCKQVKGILCPVCELYYSAMYINVLRLLNETCNASTSCCL